MSTTALLAQRSAVAGAIEAGARRRVVPREHATFLPGAAHQRGTATDLARGRARTLECRRHQSARCGADREVRRQDRASPADECLVIAGLALVADAITPGSAIARLRTAERLVVESRAAQRAAAHLSIGTVLVTVASSINHDRAVLPFVGSPSMTERGSGRSRGAVAASGSSAPASAPISVPAVRPRSRRPSSPARRSAPRRSAPAPPSQSLRVLVPPHGSSIASKSHRHFSGSSQETMRTTASYRQRVGFRGSQLGVPNVQTRSSPTASK